MILLFQRPPPVFQGLENQTTAFSNDWKVSRLTFPRLGKNTGSRFQGLENRMKFADPWRLK